MQKRISVGLCVYTFAAIFLLTGLTLNLLGKLPYMFTAVSSIFFICVAILWGYFMQNNEDKMFTLLIFIVVLLCLKVFIRQEYVNVNEQARLATMKSLINNNTFETGPYVGDKFFFHDKYYSNKPPVLSFLGAGIYSIIRYVTGIDDPFKAYYWITLFLVAIPCALAAALFYKILAFTRLEQRYRLILAFAFIFGTLLFSYGSIINNHSTAAAVLVAGFYFLLYTKFHGSAKAAISAGFFFSLATTIDLPSGVWLALFAVFILINRHPASYLRQSKYKLLIWYIVGAILPLIFHITFDHQMTGDFIPPFLHHDAMKWPGSKYNHPVYSDVWYKYLWNLTIGHHGFFVFIPLYLFSIAGIISQLKNRTNTFWLEALLILAGIIFMFLFYGVYVREHRYSGGSYGFRYLVPITTFFMFFNAIFFEENKSFPTRAVFLMVLYYSVIVAYIGAVHQFAVLPPPIYFPYPW